MSEGMIDQIIEAMRREKYRFSPARRVYIPEKGCVFLRGMSFRGVSVMR
jgi:retron-type reverse transcriptase